MMVLNNFCEGGILLVLGGNLFFHFDLETETRNSLEYILISIILIVLISKLLFTIGEGISGLYFKIKNCFKKV